MLPRTAPTILPVFFDDDEDDWMLLLLEVLPRPVGCVSPGERGGRPAVGRRQAVRTDLEPVELV